MIVTGIKEGSDSKSQSMERRDSYYMLHQTKKRVYLVIATNDASTEDDVLATSGIPALFSLLQGMYCVKRSANAVQVVRHPNTGVITNLWEVSCEFDDQLDTDESDLPPEAQAPIPRWHGENEDEVLEEDAIDGAPIQTVPGEPIILTAPVCRPILEIQRYEFYPFDPDVMMTYANRINSAPFYGAPVGCALMMPMENEPETIGGTKYERVTYRIKFKIKVVNGAMQQWGWRSKLLHHGSLYFPGLFTPAETYVDKYGNPQTINLDDFGLQLAEGAEKVYLNFNRFGPVDFGNLNLGP